MKLKLLEKRKEAKGTYSFIWKPEREVSYLPGQFFYFTLPKLNYPDPKGSTRHFTISSSPTEGENLVSTTRIRDESGFKKTLFELEIGTTIEGEGPNGTFILDENEEGSHVLLAGGIGITPFRSIIKYHFDKNLKIPLHLIYSNSIPEEIAFRKELEDISAKYDSFKLDMTITKPEESKEKWDGLKGRIDENVLKSSITNHESQAPTFWVCGPPAFIDAMEDVLGKMNITSNRVRSEKFTGY